MVDLSTTYMGVPLKNPLIVAACSISNYVDKVKKAEEVGAGGLVIRSLFEEQIHFDEMTMMDFMERAAAISPEVHSSFYPPVESGGPREHLMWVEKTRRAVKIPVFASLNAVTPGAWTSYAKQLQETGVAGLEINYYMVAADPNVTSSELEQAPDGHRRQRHAGSLDSGGRQAQPLLHLDAERGQGTGKSRCESRGHVQPLPAARHRRGRRSPGERYEAEQPRRSSKCRCAGWPCCTAARRWIWR